MPVAVAKKNSKAKATGRSLEESTIEHVLAHPQFAHELGDVATAIRAIAKRAPNEATVATNFELKLYGQMKHRLRVEFEPIKEEAIDTARHIAKGRMDSRIGALVIEYKQKNKLELPKDQAKAVAQLKNYLESLPQDFRHGAVGVLTDGWRIKFIAIQEDGSFVETAFEDLAGHHLLRLVRGALSLEKKALTPGNLIAGFCLDGDPSPAKKLALALYNALDTHPTGRSKMLFREWQAIFKLAHDDKSKQSAIDDRRKALAAALDITITVGDNETEYKALYAIQTCYAIIIKAIAYKVLSSIRFAHSEVSFRELADGSDQVLRTHLDRLECGAIFRSQGFGNLLEGDFFAWYCTDEQWDPQIGAGVKTIFSILSEYENHHMFDGGQVQDLFKDLYMAIIPDKVRHSLGEFYTPAWLADQTIQEALGDVGATVRWAALDPCCGSGTFITALIRRVLESVPSLPKQVQLQQVLSRVKGVDLNPLAALTTRINYFINLSHLIGEDDKFDVPVYLGDASYVPAPETVDGVACLSYQINTEKGPLKIRLPKSALADVEKFSRTMTSLETYIENESEDGVRKQLLSIIPSPDLTQGVLAEIEALSSRLVELQKNKWNGIWARIICNFLTTANLGKFDIIVGNPPWIDWKNLPEGYRERIKGLCVSRQLFSGDRLTGGINLNVCALIANVASQNWLKPGGTLGFLMPENLIFQQSYEGFRNLHLDSGKRLYFQRFVDWTKAGHPFAPVQHRFLGFFIGRAPVDYASGVPVSQFVKLPNSADRNIRPLKTYVHSTRFSDVEHIFERRDLLAITANNSTTAFTYATSKAQGKRFSKVSGSCAYAGRDGISVYPQELFLLEVVEPNPKKGLVMVRNFQNERAKHRVGKDMTMLETEFLYPLVRGLDIGRFNVEPSGYVVPFPYDAGSRAPVSSDDLSDRAPALMSYLNKNKVHFKAQSDYNARIIGVKHGQEFYALPRVGDYTYAPFFVAFRHNTKWQAAVVSTLSVPWDKKHEKRPIFQSHACTISQRQNGSFITEDEAHYICAIFNSPVVADFIVKSSDARSYKIQPPVNVPIFQPRNPLHRKLVSLSKTAHESHADAAAMKVINQDLDKAYMALLAAA
ncbi:MAG: hypothetical protein M3Q42_15335 [Pseudomonadota bacterium]|nr:hypothetical protein [Pseudomonadota bacterium]